MEEIIGQVEITGPVLTEKLSENEVIKKATKTGKRKVKDTDEAGSGKKIASRGKHLKTRESSQEEIENFRRGEGKVRDKKNRPKEQDVMKKMKQRQNKTIQSATSPSLKDLTNGAEDTEQETQSSEEQERESEMGGARLDNTDSPGHNEREDEDTDQYVSWVQCSVAECGKWRKLSEDVDPSGLPEKWTCQQNTDPDFNSCRVPEENCIPSEEIFSDLVPGSLVWARQIGYPWWPAIVERDPDTDGYLEFRKKSDTIPYKYHVTFLGDAATRAWVHRSRVKNFTDLSVDQLSKEVEKSDAILMANEALSLSLKERLVQFGFSSRYVSDIESSQEDSDIAEILQLFCERTDSGSSDEEKKKKKPNLAEGKEKCGTRKRANKKMSSKTKRNEKKKGRREEEERDRATPSCSTATPPEKRARKPAKIRQKSKAKQQSETGPLESDRKDEDDLKSLDLKEPGDREKLFISLLEE